MLLHTYPSVTGTVYLQCYPAMRCLHLQLSGTPPEADALLAARQLSSHLFEEEDGIYNAFVLDFAELTYASASELDALLGAMARVLEAPDTLAGWYLCLPRDIAPSQVQQHYIGQRWPQFIAHPSLLLQGSLS